MECSHLLLKQILTIFFCFIFNREKLIAVVFLGEVFLVFPLRYITALRIEYSKCVGKLHNKSCYVEKRFLSLFSTWQYWEFADSVENFKKIDWIYGYSMNLDSLSIHWFQVPTTLADLAVENLLILIEFCFSQYPQIPWSIAAELWKLAVWKSERVQSCFEFTLVWWA